jgi:hypothetical protein
VSSQRSRDAGTRPAELNSSVTHPSNPGPSRPQGFTTQSPPTTHRAPIVTLGAHTRRLSETGERTIPASTLRGSTLLTLHKRPSPKFQNPVRGLHSLQISHGRRIQPPIRSTKGETLFSSHFVGENPAVAHDDDDTYAYQYQLTRCRMSPIPGETWIRRTARRRLDIGQRRPPRCASGGGFLRSGESRLRH